MPLMADVSIYVAVISASAAILGAAVSPLSTAFQNVRLAERDRREQSRTELRQACSDLLAAVIDLRTQVVNDEDYHGPEMVFRLARVRELAGQARAHAFAIALMAPRPLGVTAQTLSTAAADVAKEAAANTNLEQGSCLQATDCTELDRCADAFRDKAVELAIGLQADEPSRDGTAATEDRWHPPPAGRTRVR
jgi:Mn2+/Fe2+ NRAMP family transporter